VTGEGEATQAGDGGGDSVCRRSAAALARERRDASAAGDDRWAADRWGGLVGYNEQKAQVEESLLLPLLFPEAFDAVVAGTRDVAGTRESVAGTRESVAGTRDSAGTGPDIRPKAILLHGAPGTGKTSCARAMAARSRLPLVYLPLEAVASKWYGEGEQKLAAVFDACGRLARELDVQAPAVLGQTGSGGEVVSTGHTTAVCRPAGEVTVQTPAAPGQQDSSGPAGGGVVLLFLDEIDALAGARGSNSMHEATRRSLSVLLRKIDGFEADEAIVVIGATNRSAGETHATVFLFNTPGSSPYVEGGQRQPRAAQECNDSCPQRMPHLRETPAHRA
jgi:hypothetical protein